MPRISCNGISIYFICRITPTGKCITPAVIRLCGTTIPIPSKAFIGGFGVTLGGIFFPNVCDCEVVSYIELFKYPSGE